MTVTAPTSSRAQVRRAVDLAGLTAWLDAFLQGGVSADDVLDAAERVGLRLIRTSQADESPILALAHWRGQGFDTARLVLPTPADPAGLPGPAELTRSCVAAGAAIVLTGLRRNQHPDEAVVIIADDEDIWPARTVPLRAATVGDWLRWREARSEFLLTVSGHADALADLDVAADPRGMRDLVDAEDEEPLPRLPTGLDDSRQELLARARLVAFLAASALHDDGAAINAAEVTSRAAHLRALARAANRAMAAAVSGP